MGNFVSQRFMFTETNRTTSQNYLILRNYCLLLFAPCTLLHNPIHTSPFFVKEQGYAPQKTLR